MSLDSLKITKRIICADDNKFFALKNTEYEWFGALFQDY